MRLKILTIIGLFLVLNCTSILAQDSFTDGIYNVRQFGARGDGTFLNTKAIQSTIDKAAENGGGVVYFPPGNYVSGSIVLRDFITLRFEAGAVLLGSKDMKDYPSDLGRIEMHPDVFFAGPLIYAENAKYIGIEGRGIINGQGTRDVFIPLPQTLLRPGLVRFKNCRFVTVKDLRHAIVCENVTGLEIINSKFSGEKDGESTIRLNQVKNAVIKENRVKDNVPLFLKVQGNSEDIMLIGNYMHNVAKMFDLDSTVGSNNIRELNNF